MVLTTHIAVEPLNRVETSLSRPQYNIYTYWQLKLYSTTSHKLTLVVAGENYLTKDKLRNIKLSHTCMIYLLTLLNENNITLD